MTYNYGESVAVLGPLATFAEPHSYDLCDEHSARLTVPKGWNVIKQEVSQQDLGPSDDDVMAIADAVREVASVREEPQPVVPELGRRGHLRVLPSE